MTEVLDPAVWNESGGILGMVIMALFAFMALLTGVLIKVMLWNSQERKEYLNSHKTERQEFKESHENVAKGFTDAVSQLGGNVEKLSEKVSENTIAVNNIK